MDFGLNRFLTALFHFQSCCAIYLSLELSWEGIYLRDNWFDYLSVCCSFRLQLFLSYVKAKYRIPDISYPQVDSLFYEGRKLFERIEWLHHLPEDKWFSKLHWP